MNVVVRGFVVIALALALVPEIVGLVRAPARVLAGSDFGAFYCGAWVAAHGDDPYRLAPLKACEVRRVYGPGGVRYRVAGIDPAPFPPYFFTAFAPLSALPYATVGTLWHLSAIVACAAAVWALATMLPLPWWAIAPAVALATFESNFTVGQLPPFVFCLLAAAALLLERGKTVSAALVATVAMVEPHVAFPPLLALFIWRRAARLPLVLAAAIALGLSFVMGGGHAWYEYVHAVLPAHAVAEAPVFIQYSASWLLRFFGVDERLATQIGFFQYVLVCGGAVALAGGVARGMRAPSAILLFPAAAAVFGGPFIHYGQVSIALLFAYLLAVRAPSAALRTAGWLSIGLIALSIGEPSFIRHGPLILCVIATVVAGIGVRGPVRRVAVTAAASLTFVAVTLLTRHLAATGLTAASGPGDFAARGYDPTLASTVMGLEWRRNPPVVTPSWQSLAQKLPVWSGVLITLVGGGLCAMDRSRGAQPIRRTPG